ncbi:MAG: hypothetical protein ABJA78_12635 [Ferruginibacter sp.]
MTTEKTKSDFLPITVECFILVTYSLYFLIEKIQLETITPIYSTTIFWIAIAYFIFFSGNFFLFLYRLGYPKNDLYTVVYTPLVILKNLLICIGIAIKNGTMERTDDDKSVKNLKLDFTL